MLPIGTPLNPSVAGIADSGEVKLEAAAKWFLFFPASYDTTQSLARFRFLTYETFFEVWSSTGPSSCRVNSFFPGAGRRFPAQALFS